MTFMNASLVVRFICQVYKFFLSKQFLFLKDSLSQNSSFCNSLRPCNEYNSKCIDLQRGTIDFTKPTHLCLCKNNATIGYPSCKTEIHKFAKNNASFEIIQSNSQFLLVLTL